MRLTTQRCAAVLLDRPAVGPTWWELSTPSLGAKEKKALVIWFNSTLGLVSLLFSSEEGEGPWIKLKKNKLAGIGVLDVTNLEHGQLERIAATFDEHRDRDLSSVASLESDPVRVAIDNQFASVFEFDEDRLARLRRMLATEPRLRPIPAHIPDEPLTTAPPELMLF